MGTRMDTRMSTRTPYVIEQLVYMEQVEY